LSGKVRSRLSKLRFLWCAIAALALNASVCLGQHYSFSDESAGLENKNVDSIIQDHRGYLWLGTENGLYRYDGNQFRKYGPADGLTARLIQSLYETSDGTLFVGTTAGIYFETAEGSFAAVPPPEPLERFSQHMGTVFTEAAPGQVAIADKSGAYLLRRNGTSRWDAERLNLEPGPIWSVIAMPGGALWYGCGLDLCRYEGGKTTHMGAALHLPATQWMHLLLTLDGHVWIRGDSNIGEIIPGEGRYVAHPLPGPSKTEPYDVLVADGKGRIAASHGASLGLWENGKWRMVTPGNGLTSFDISSLFTDREGSLWVGVAGHGLMRWVGQDRWEAFTTTEGLNDDIVWTALRDKSGRMWVGTESGLDWIPAGADTAKKWTSGGIETTRALSLSEGADGNIWLGSEAGRLVRVDVKTLAGREWKTPRIERTVCDRSGRLWIATGGGLYVMDTTAGNHTPQQVTDSHFARADSHFTDLSLSPNGDLWAASDSGLYRLNKDGWRRIDPGLSSVTPNLVEADGHGNVWTAGNFAGIMRLHVEGDRVVESEHIVKPRLLSEEVEDLFVDSRGWLWVGQDAGVSMFDGRTWHSFTQTDGLIWNDLDSNGIVEDRDGSIWFGTSGGLSHLMKPAAAPAMVPGTPAVSEITYGSTMLSNGSQIPWSASPLQISIATLSFRDAHNIHIRYRLLGLEQDWVETSETNVRYPQLDPGKYRFQVEAVDFAGGATSGITEIDFRIAERWWQNGALHLAIGLLMGLAMIGFLRYRLHLLVTQRRDLESAVMRRTEDLQLEKTELLQARDQMRHYAEHDDLTGLWNHRIIIERLRAEADRSFRERLPVSLIVVDLDHFKKINDTYGHPTGDLALKTISAVFQSSVRSYDWVGRYGGEEFLLILPGSTLTSARIRAEQMRMAIEAAHIVDNNLVIKVTASFGVASGIASNYQTLLKAADKALYSAKDNGRNCVMAVEIEPETNTDRE